ncbi:hypothetical protein EC973_000826 [Apophysomyces ossiformis]|uniref:SH3 domain-containing protein n=1 Tax=Apophysomyces ossiformis TaxID=679940 RepID=A0A8H7ENL2_9FUNG|nr:hypothetical protein EC973_000826 [Apophysomyces ossiformis]
MASGFGVLDMALDDVISQNRSNKRKSTSRTIRGGVSKARGTRSSNRGNSFSPYPSRPIRNAPTQSRGARNSLVVANLHHNVSEKDLYCPNFGLPNDEAQELFGQIGALKRAFLHIAPSGKSSGVADIVFVRPNDAERARATYNNVELDGRPMRISFAPSIPTVATSVPSGRAPSGPRRNDRPSRGRGGRRQRDSRPKASEQDLDAQMDSYMSGGGVASDTEHHTGTGAVSTRLSNAKQTYEELNEFYELRAQIEKEYGEKLLQLSKHMLGRAEQGSLADALFHIPVALETTARAHVDLAQQMHDHLETSLQMFVNEQAKKTDTVSRLLSAYMINPTLSYTTFCATKEYRSLQILEDRYHQKHSALLRAKDDHLGETMKLAGMVKFLKEKGQDLPEAESAQIKEDIEESEHVVAAAEHTYQQAQADWEQLQETWDIDRQSTYETLRKIEQQRLEFIRTSLLTFANMLGDVHIVDDQNCSRIRMAMESMDIPKDMERFDIEIGVVKEREMDSADPMSNVFKEVEDMLDDVVPAQEMQKEEEAQAPQKPQEQHEQHEQEEKNPPCIISNATATASTSSTTVEDASSATTPPEIVPNTLPRSRSPSPKQDKFKPVPNPAFHSPAMVTQEEELSDDESVVLQPKPQPKEEKWMISTRRQPQQLPVKTQNAHIYDRQSMIIDPKRVTKPIAAHVDPLLTKPARPALKIDIPNSIHQDNNRRNNSNSDDNSNGIAPRQEAKQVIDSVRAQLRQAGSTVEKRQSRSPEKPRFSLARAKWPYEAKMDQEISFLYGDVLAVFHKQADGWWDAEIMDAKRRQRGLVPGNYMEIL